MCFSLPINGSQAVPPLATALLRLSHDQNNQYMLILEVTIVLLFIIDLAILFRGMK